MPVLTNILTSKYYTHSALHSDFICTKLHNALPLQSGGGHRGKEERVYLDLQKEFKGESRRYIRLFPLPACQLR